MRKISFDTNVLLYAEGLRRVVADDAKIAVANTLVKDLAESDDALFLAAQSLAELHHGLTKLLKLKRASAAERVLRWNNLAEVGPTDTAVLKAAMALASGHNLQTYDAIILTACAEAGCDVLFSEDMQHGFTWRGVTVINPFA